jgi:beta-lactamase regulating signal transducer with metallopeptidase domain
VNTVLDWLGTYALHSTVALGGALLLGLVLRDRAIAWQEGLLRFVMWAALASSAVQFFVLGGPWWGQRGVADEPRAIGELSLLDVPAFAAASVSAAPAVAEPLLPWSTWIGLLAMGAAACGLTFWWLSRRRLARVLAHRQPERSARVLLAAADVARELGLRRLPRLSRCERLLTPIAFGWLRPETSLPARVDELDAPSLRAMLAHEFAHLRRRDPAVLASVSLLQALFPWQVLLPLVRRRWLRLVELRCDAIAADRTSPTAVARCLLEVASWLQAQRPVAGLALGMAARPSSLRDRIEAALQPRAARPPRRLLSFAFGSVSLSALAVAGPGLEPEPTAAAPEVAFAILDDITDASPLQLVLAEHALLAAEARQLRADLAGRPTSPELEQLLMALERRLLVVDRLATRVQQRLESRDTEAR